MRVFPEVVGIDQQEFANGLLKAGVELIAKSRLNRYSAGANYILCGSPDASSARKQEVFIEGRFESPRIGNAQNRSGFLDVVSDAEAWLRARLRNQAIIAVQAEADVEHKVAQGNGVLRIECVVIDIRGGVEIEWLSAAGQVER